MSKRMAIAIVAAVFSSAWQAAAQIHPEPLAPVPAAIHVPENGVTVPMQDMGRRPVVEVKINGKGPYRFVLDTGATTSMISDELSRELSLSMPGGMHVAAVGSATTTTMVLVHDLQIGDAVLEDVIAATMPLGSLLKGENAPRGVLSAGIFPGYLLAYDYPRKEITIKKGTLGAADSKTIFQYAESDVLPTVPVKIAGHETRVHLDTGSGYGLTLPLKFLGVLHWPRSLRKVGPYIPVGGNFRCPLQR